MSQTAARRLVREGVIHTLQISDPLDFYAFEPEDPFWDLLIPTSENGYGTIIALQIPINLTHHLGESIAASAEAAAAALVVRVHEYFDMWDMYHDDLPFHWALRLDALGAGSDWHVGPGKLPSFSNHEDDVPTGRLPRQKYFDWGGYVYHANGTTLQILYPDVPTFYTQFPDDHFTEPTSALAATITIGDETRTITGFDHQTQTITVSSAFPTNVTNEQFRINRSDVGGGLQPCYFFKEGAEDMGEWVQAFCAAMQAAMEDPEVWDSENIGPPVAVTVSDEDLNLSGVDYANYHAVYYNLDGTGRASDEDYRIDENHTLAEWHSAFARDRSGELLEWNPLPMGGFSPTMEDFRSYLIATISTAYNYYRELSTWQYFREIWPRAHLSQYQLGNRYGVTIEVGEEDGYIPVPFGPAEEVYHGTREWKGNVTWDAYYCLINPATPPYFGPDGGIVPVGYASADAFEGTVAAWDSQHPNLLTVNAAHSNPANPQVIGNIGIGGYLAADFEVFVQLPTNSVHPNYIFKVSVTGWNGSTLTFTLDDDLYSVSADDEFAVYYPSFPYFQYIDSEGEIRWSMLETFLERYDEDFDTNGAGFLSTSKKWAADRARAHTRAHPEKPYTIYFGLGTLDAVPYDGVLNHVSFMATYPHNPNNPMHCKDGWLDGTDWYEVGVQAMNFGVNEFVWYIPELTNSTIALQVMRDAITGIQSDYWNPGGQNLPQHYRDIACIADWDQSGLLSHDDVKDYYTAYLAMDPIADLNNDGAFTEADVAIFEAADDCGLERDCNGNNIPDSEEIAQGDLDPEDEYPDLDTDDDGRIDGCQNCAADWDVNNEVEVTDIFAFLTDWFANDPAAQNFGGTPGVAAIFAFLTAWFAHGVGACGT
ncbi:MAG: hypothetical protein KF699_12155 [Phycisphaeraceae bacterium]|nr:hypothetical protein [Phycisphaeraceae bacterium]MBX3407159.1 hypothetical protein [Phycisphaeraceae bacterium]